MAKQAQAAPGELLANPLLASPPPPLLGPAPAPAPAAYILIPVARRRRRFSDASSALLSLAVAALLTASIFALWPSGPELTLDAVRFHALNVDTSPAVALTISGSARVRVRNRALFSLFYRHLDVDLQYRGEHLGTVLSGAGRVEARGVSYVDVSFKLDGVRVLHDVFYLIEDLTRGSIPFDADTRLDGSLRLLIFNVPVKGRINCSVNVNPTNCSITQGVCYPKV